MEIVPLLKALADETRIRIMNLLKNGELCVCDIEGVLNIQQSNASRHLNKLKVAGLILSDKKSQWVYYRINEQMLIKYPFIKTLLEEELFKIKTLKMDYERLKVYKEEHLSCE